MPSDLESLVPPHIRRRIPPLQEPCLVQTLGLLSSDTRPRRRLEDLDALGARDIAVVRAVDQTQPQATAPLPHGGDQRGEAVQRGPAVDDEAQDGAHQRRGDGQGAQEGHDAAERVVGEHGGQAAEGGDEDDAGQVEAALAGELLGGGGGDGGAEALAEEEYAGRGQLQRGEGEVDEGGGVGDEAGLGRGAGAVAEAPVVEGDNVPFRMGGAEEAILWGAGVLGDVAGVAVDCVEGDELAGLFDAGEGMGCVVASPTGQDEAGFRVLLQETKGIGGGELV